MSARPRCIFALWGKNAQDLSRDESYGLRESRYNLFAGHPSPINTTRPFVGCGHFVQINTLLQQMGEDPIDWNID